MMHSAFFPTDFERRRKSWAVRTALAVRSVVGVPVRLVTAAKATMARDRSRAQIAALDAHLRRDIGLSPFDTFYGWRGPDFVEDGTVRRALNRLRMFTFAR